MKAAIISYDLKNVTPYDNLRVKAALASFANTHSKLQGLNVLSPFPQWVDLRLPDTTLLLTVDNSAITAEQIAAEVVGLIEGLGATPDKVYVAFIELEGDFLYNSK